MLGGVEFETLDLRVQCGHAPGSLRVVVAAVEGRAAIRERRYAPLPFGGRLREPLRGERERPHLPRPVVEELRLGAGGGVA